MKYKHIMWRTLFETYNSYQDTHDRYRLRDKLEDYDPFPMSTRSKGTMSTPAKRSRRGSRTTRTAGNYQRGVSIRSRKPSLARNYFKYHASAFPQRQYETIRYAYSPTNQSLAANTYAESPFSLNGPYDVDATAGQPAGWAKLMAVYTKCFVRAAKIRVDFQNLINGGAWANLNVGVTITTNSTSLGSLAGAIQPGLCTYGVLTGSPDTKTITIDCDIAKFLGVTYDARSGIRYVNTPSASPSDLVVAHLWLHNSYGVAAVYNFTVTIDFDCEFFDPIPVT